MRWCILIVLVTACGGRLAVDGDDGAPPDADGVGDASDIVDGTDFPICPPSAPVLGSSCAMSPTQGCKYYVRMSGTWICQALVCGKARQWQGVPGEC
jgi:hypothetical protein